MLIPQINNLFLGWRGCIQRFLAPEAVKLIVRDDQSSVGIIEIENRFEHSLSDNSSSLSPANVNLVVYLEVSIEFEGQTGNEVLDHSLEEESRTGSSKIPEILAEESIQGFDYFCLIHYGTAGGCRLNFINNHAAIMTHTS